MALTKEEEYKLGMIIKTFRETEDASMAEEAMEAVNVLFENNKNLAYKMAHDFLRTTSAYHYEREDAVQDASLALSTAIWKYDPTKNARVNTYSYFYIRKFLSEAPNRNRKVQFSPGQYMRYKQAKEEYENEPNKAYINEHEYILKKSGLKLKEIISLENAIMEPSSMDYIVDNTGKATTLGEVLEDKNTSSEKYTSGLSLVTESLLELLTKKEELYMRYNLDDENLKTPFDQFLINENITEKEFKSEIRKITNKLKKLSTTVNWGE